MKRRTDEEMMEQILSVARKDDRIRAVWMNGSRANPNAPKDPWQDFDIVYAVTDMEFFTKSDDWVDVFGPRVIMQSSRNQLSADPAEYENRYIYLMQFQDGNRIDLSLVPLSRTEEFFLSDRMCVPLLDKDGRLPKIPPPTDRDYWVARPTEREFACCCNEFYWVSTYVAKGLWRNEISYAHAMLDGPVRDQLLKLLSWEAGIRTDFSVSVGKCGKYLNRYLPPEDWTLYCRTYCTADPKDIKTALFTMQQLFSHVSRTVADALSFPLDTEEARRVLAYLQGE